MATLLTYASAPPLPVYNEMTMTVGGISPSPPSLQKKFFFFFHQQLIVMRDRETNRSRGFAFITYSTEAEAEYAIQEMNDKELDGRRIRINIANARSSGGGGGGGGGPSKSLFSLNNSLTRPSYHL
jgi:RNA recognition motif-containing protein